MAAFTILGVFLSRKLMSLESPASGREPISHARTAAVPSLG
jgi:hypothetical protein